MEEKLFRVRYERVYISKLNKIFELKALVYTTKESQALDTIEKILREKYGRLGFPSYPEIKIIEEGTEEFQKWGMYEILVRLFDKSTSKETVIECQIRPEFYKPQ